MRLKNAFTLAEILVVVTIIVIISVISLPIIIDGVNDSHFRTGFKKAYLSLNNLAALVKTENNLPKGTDWVANANNFYVHMMKNLKVLHVDKTDTLDADCLTEPVQYVYLDNEVETTFGKGTLIQQTEDASVPVWLTTNDGISFVVLPGVEACRPKSAFASAQTFEDLHKLACLLVMIDVNGVEKGPNKLEPQSFVLTSDTQMRKLTGDRYYVFVARDGIHTGHLNTSVGARLILNK